MVARAAEGRSRVTGDHPDLFRALFDHCPDGLLVAGPDGRCVEANAAASELLGISRQELLGRDLVDLLSAASAGAGSPGALGAVSQTRPDGSTRRLELRRLAVDGLTVSILRDVTDEVAQREALTKSEARFRTMIEKSSEAVTLTSAEGVTFYRSPALARHLGWTPADMVGRGPIDNVALEDRPMFAEAVARLYAGEREIALQFRGAHRDGSVRWMDGAATNLLDDPNVRAIVGTFRDITERKGLEDAMRRSEVRYRRLMEELPEPVVVHVEGRVAYANPAAAIALGVAAPDDLIGRAMIEFARPETQEQITARMALGGDLPRAEQTFVRPADGRSLHVEVKTTPIDFEGRAAALSIGRDITQRVEAERDAMQAQRRLRAQFHAAPLPTYVWQRTEGAFVLLDVNQAAMSLADGHPEDRVGVSADVFFAGTPEIPPELARCLDEGGTFQREIERDKRRLVLTCASAPPDLVIVHAEDITARTQLEQQFRQAQKMEAVGQLAGGVAHDFNNLLSVILSYASLAADDLKPGDPLRHDLGEIRAAAERATALTRQLLAFSRRQVLQPRVIEIEGIIEGMRSMLGRLLGENIEVAVSAAKGLGRVLSDPGQIEQVVMNLAVNARDAMPDGGKLTVDAANVILDEGYAATHLGVSPGPYVLLAVSDTGMGMDAATRARIFEPFFTTKEPGKGTGLGLSTVFGIVKQSGGSVSVYSEPGHGSTFKVYLPRTDRLPDVLTTKPGRGARGTETILLVEDEDQVRAVGCTILRKHGYVVLEAANAGEAFLISQTHPETIHLLLTDVVMPRMSGRMLAEQLAPQRPGMRVLFASGYTDDAVVRHGVLDAGVAFVQKPFTPDVLLRKVRDVLDA